jgi:CHAD domain-containing protein
MIETSPTLESQIGLAHWMEQTLHQCSKAEADFNSDAVHDLRTALRRCRSLAEGIRVFDRDPAWKKMRRAGKCLFAGLGELRDTQVMMEWIEKLAPEDDPVRQRLAIFLASQEQELRKTAAASLQAFDRRQWRTWANKLPTRADRIPVGSEVFAHLALERWAEARALHLRASRNRTNIAFHDLRIAVKRFRYTIENFLPRLHEFWGRDLKEVQDALGEIHDLDVLWETAVRLKIFTDAAERAQWRARIEHERNACLDAYRTKMLGPDSLWYVWRAALPNLERCRELGLERLRIWASFLDPNLARSKHVTRLALQLFDGLPSHDIRILRGQRDVCRWILQAAGVMHAAGLSRTNSGYHKESARLMRKLPAPLGWSTSELRTAALVVRYHRGALPSEAQQLFAALSPSRQKLVQFLGGILRLASACDSQADTKILSLNIGSTDPVITVRAEGYLDCTPLAEQIAAARHLLELTYRRPIFVLPAQEKVRVQAA